MSIQLYHTDLSPPARVVRLVVKYLSLNVEKKEVDIVKGEHLKSEFLAINPFHVVPTIVDGDYKLWESRAILTYLVDKYAPGHSLYPSDLKARATINRWLFWDAGSLYTPLIALFGHVFRGNAPVPEAEKIFKAKAKDLDNTLEKSKYVASDSLTIADLSICITVTTGVAVGFDLIGFKNIDRWLKQLESDLTTSVWSSLVSEPANALGEYVKSRL